MESSSQIETSSTNSTGTIVEDLEAVLEKVESAGSNPTPVDETAAVLEQKLQAEIDGRKEDRVYFFSIIALLFDVIIFKVLDNVIAFLVIVLLQLPLLISYAAKSGVEAAAILWARMMSYLMSSKDE